MLYQDDLTHTEHCLTIQNFLRTSENVFPWEFEYINEIHVC
jgi:hypothetical protein